MRTNRKWPLAILDWFRRLFRRKKEVEAEPVQEHAQRFEGLSFLVKTNDVCPSVLDYIADMLSEKTLIPTHLRAEMAAARKLPAIAWDLARKHREECPPELRVLRSAALEYARRLSAAVLLHKER